MAAGQEKGCLDRIREVYSSLNSAEKKAAQYILENPGDIIHFSITELADSSSVSEATVFRLCNKLGYKGYQQMKINLAGTVVEPIENIHQEIKEKDDMYIIMNKILNANLYSMENTIRINQPEALEKAVDLLVNANQVMFFGMGGSGALANDAHHKFIRTGIRCQSSSDAHWQTMMVSTAGEGDVVIAFSNSGSNRELVDVLEIARRNRVKVISITGNAKSPIAKVSDLVLVSYGKESMFRSEAMESRITALLLVDCMYVGVALRKKEETLETLKKIREGIADKRY